MKKNGQWNPPEINERMAEVLDIFYHLSKKRKLIQGGMNGILGDEYISETEITAYFQRNEVSFEFDWFQRLLYACDDEFIKLSKKAYEKQRAIAKTKNKPKNNR